MHAKFYFEIQYFNFDWKITITLLHSHRNTQQWQVHDVTATVGKTSGCSKSQNLPTHKSYSMYTLSMWYWILMKFKNVLKFMKY